MKKYLLLFFVSLFLIQAKANQYALHFCDKQNESTAIEFAKNHELNFVAFLPYENTILVSNTTLFDYAEICFISRLNTFEEKLAFHTNELIIRTTPSDIQELKKIANQNQWTLAENDIIPLQFKIENAAKNETDLIAYKNQLTTILPNSIVSINTTFTLETAMVDDPLYNRQWAIENTGSTLQGNGTENADMNVDSAWTISTGNNIKIAILDSGVDTLHEDLADNLLPGFDGYANDNSNTQGYPTPNFSNDGHGTACAGIAAAHGDNNTGVAGIAYTAQIIPVRIFYYQDYGSGIGVQATTSTESLVNGAAYAWRVGNCDVMSTSAGLSDLFIAVLGIDITLVNTEIEAAFYQGRNGFGVPMFFSSGNDDIDDVLWPADLPLTIAIGASSMCDERKNPDDCSSENWGSSYGEMLDIIAPGTLISSTDMTGSNGYSSNNYTFTFNGTSAACPNAAGVGALILSTNPNLHARDVKAILNTTANKVDGYNYTSSSIHGTWNEEVGHGRVDAFAAVKSAETYSSTVAINEQTASHFSIYPNPSNGTISFENIDEKEIYLQVFNPLGQIIDEVSISINQTLNRTYEKGLYFISILDDDSRQTQSFVVK